MATVDGKKTGGRKAGTPNKMPHKLRADLAERLQALGFDPIANLVKVNVAAWKEYERSEVIFDAIEAKRANWDMAPLSQSEAVQWLKLAESSSAEIVQYLIPKLKSQELKGADGSDLIQTFTQLVKAIAEQKV